MKYMGSKKHLLSNGLGKLIIEKARNSNNFFDLFCGSASVSWFAAANLSNRIIACDLQAYSAVLANSIITRLEAKPFDLFIEEWLNPVREKFIHLNRNLKLNRNNYSYITKSYSGYYFSYEQSIKFDLLLSALPKNKIDRTIAKAALIISASNCVASPGHTAQPFQPTKSSMKYIFESWSRDPFKYVEKALEEICPKFSKSIGSAIVADAQLCIEKVKENDLVFLDPPYSGVHYSRFYHVLETFAKEKSSQVEGSGRYPKLSARPSSLFSMRSKSIKAMDDLLSALSQKKAKVILTFPNHECSNGLSGSTVKEIAAKYFKVEKEKVKNNFSTLGGNKIKRPARVNTEELILILEHK